MQRTDEREVKFDIEADAAAPDLSRLPADLEIVDRPEIRLGARYFDTSGLDLLRRGITLRHRRDLSGAGEDLWTLKLPDAQQGTALSRTELSWPGAEVDVPDEARRLLTAVLHDEDLRVVAAFVTVRHPQEVRDRAGRRLAEIDDDRVTVTAPTAKVFRQIEVELDGGDADLITRLTKVLRRSGASRSDNAPKLRLALGDRVAGLEEAGRAPGSGELTLGELFRARLTASLDKLVTHDIGLRLERRSEDVHQARVACRRLRSDLKTFRPIVEPRWAAVTSDELRWWGNVLGAVRDLDVLGRRIAARAEGPDDPDADGFAAIAVRFAAQQSAAWERLREGLESDRYQRLLARLDAAVVEVPLAPPGPAGQPAPDDPAAAISVLVRGPWRRLRRTVRALPAHPSNVQLHGVRIRAKQLRYAAESAASVIGRPAAGLAKAAEDLQTELGEQHDAVVAEEALRGLVPSLHRDEAFVAGRCVAIERTEARSRGETWLSAWRALDRKRLQRWLR